MENLGLHSTDERVSFGQIYGMGEQLSIPLGIDNHHNIDMHKIHLLFIHFKIECKESSRDKD